MKKIGLSIICAVFCMVFISVSYAQTVAPDPCDPKYYDSLEARAWLEAQREITQNQNLIFKPDSVLEYTCYDLFLRELAQHALDMFSETTRWGLILGPQSMDLALQKLVGTALTGYILQNFELAPPNGTYDLLGGRLDGTDHVPSIIIGGSYTCKIMNDVWKEAKCFDFIQEPAEDGFFTFAEYQADEDKRFLPNRCPKASLWQTNINTATEQVPWQKDNVKTYLNNLDPAQCGSIQPIPTGLTVKNTNFPNGFREHVCIQPGCHYQPSGGGQSGQCVSN